MLCNIALMPRLPCPLTAALHSEGLDWVINEAHESGIRLILTLTDSRGDYGGMPEYVRAVLGDKGSITDFYTSRTVRVRADLLSNQHTHVADHGWGSNPRPSNGIE